MIQFQGAKLPKTYDLSHAVSTLQPHTHITNNHYHSALTTEHAVRSTLTTQHTHPSCIVRGSEKLYCESHTEILPEEDADDN